VIGIGLFVEAIDQFVHSSLDRYHCLMVFCTSINLLFQNSLAGLTQLESSKWNLAWSMRLLGDLVVATILGVIDINFLDPSRLFPVQQWLKTCCKSILLLRHPTLLLDIEYTFRKILVETHWTCPKL
jgi:hypothetical protein